MASYVGIDLHRRRSVIVVLNEAGDRVWQSRIENSRLNLETELRAIVAVVESPVDVVVEAPWGWYWAADVIAEVGLDLHLAHPLAIKGYENRRVKTDWLDAVAVQSTQTLPPANNAEGRSGRKHLRRILPSPVGGDSQSRPTVEVQDDAFDDLTGGGAMVASSASPDESPTDPDTGDQEPENIEKAAPHAEDDEVEPDVDDWDFDLEEEDEEEEE